MVNKGIRQFKEFEASPFTGEEIGISIDMDSLLKFSKSSQNVMRYLLYKKSYLDDKFLFDLDDFIKFTGYTSRTAYRSGIIDLISKDILAKTKLPHLYWVNKEFLRMITFKGDS